MIVFLNGQFVPEEQAVVSVFDRAFLYGDGLFETARVLNGKPFRWTQHLERLRRGADFLGIRMPFPEEDLQGFALELVRRNGWPDAVLRLTLSRGVGVRGYSPKGADRPTVVMSLHAAPVWTAAPPPQWKLITSTFRLPAREPSAQFKTSSKLLHVLARAEADAAGADEALLLNTDGCAVAASSSNLFWIEEGVVCTPPVAGGVLPGVTRAVVLELCRADGLSTQEAAPRPKELLRAEGVFLSLSSWGIVAVAALDRHTLRLSPLVPKVRERYLAQLRAETA